ncbi:MULTISPECIES: MATE family efflux transporter [Rhizobium]|uniref:MATE efflux family protein n=1 Tax=Rhizobium favelukesii TaxID=348824 RepID=W6RNU7_9HYPH|nr:MULTISPECIES: MATE family efflux transporter [Rhizobium]MCS0462903.1 MATE family efflux transporter [Rhizobium favelukesii]UFS84922.1 MATE family efflux transporter [Rhizobium sp. T136]CDM60528.1 MATE efflux family protein [Rhizobium favelukesii]
MKSVRLERIEKDAMVPLVLRLAGPTIVGLCVCAAYQLLNAFFVRRLGAQAVAALAITYPITMILTLVGQAVGTGAASTVARSLGRPDYSSAGAFALTAIVLGVGIAILASGSIATSISVLLTWFGASNNTLPYAIEYLIPLLVAQVLLVFNMICGFIVRAEGNTLFSMVTQMVAFALNALLDPALIFGLDLGIEGAGLATLIAQTAAAALYVWHFATARGVVTLGGHSKTGSLERAGVILTIGSPAVLASVTSIAAIWLLNSIASTFGDDILAGVGVATRLLLIVALPISGLCIGAQAAIGYNIGAGRGDRVRQALTAILSLCLVFSSMCALIGIAQSHALAAWFVSESSAIAVAERAIAAFLTAFVCFPPMAVTIALLQAKGEGTRASLLAITRHGLFLIPLLLVLPHWLGVNGLIISTVLSEAAACLIAMIVLYREWRRLSRDERSLRV